MAKRTRSRSKTRSRSSRASSRVGLITLAVVLGLMLMGRAGWLPPEVTEAVEQI